VLVVFKVGFCFIAQLAWTAVLLFYLFWYLPIHPTIGWSQALWTFCLIWHLDLSLTGSRNYRPEPPHSSLNEFLNKINIK
jgi:hypothetical protein